MPSPVDLEALERLRAEATQGEWTVVSRFVGPLHVQTGDETVALVGAELFWIVDANARFIAHAANELPAMIAEIRSLRERLSKAEEALAEERERCAKVIEDHPFPTQFSPALWGIEKTMLAAAIRAQPPEQER